MKVVQEQAATHFQKIGETANDPGFTALDRAADYFRHIRDNATEESETLRMQMDAVPTRDEAFRQLVKMKDSAGGEDEITAGLLRALGPLEQDAIYKVLVEMWKIPPEQWEEIGS